jgi:hypothetical protein
MIPRDWHRELKVTTLGASAGRGGSAAQPVREFTSWRDVDEIEEFGNAAAGRLESSVVSPTQA